MKMLRVNLPIFTLLEFLFPMNYPLLSELSITGSVTNNPILNDMSVLTITGKVIVLPAMGCIQTQEDTCAQDSL